MTQYYPFQMLCSVFFSVVVIIIIIVVIIIINFWPRHAACRILVPQPGIESRPLAVRVQSPNCWTIRELPLLLFLKSFFDLLNWSVTH